MAANPGGAAERRARGRGGAGGGEGDVSGGPLVSGSPIGLDVTGDGGDECFGDGADWRAGARARLAQPFGNRPHGLPVLLRGRVSARRVGGVDLVPAHLDTP